MSASRPTKSIVILLAGVVGLLGLVASLGVVVVAGVVGMGAGVWTYLAAPISVDFEDAEVSVSLDDTDAEEARDDTVPDLEARAESSGGTAENADEAPAAAPRMTRCRCPSEITSFIEHSTPQSLHTM